MIGRALIVGAAAGAVAAAALAFPAHHAVADLHSARAERDAARGLVASPPHDGPPVPPAMALRANSATAARAALASRVRRQALDGGVLVENVSAAALADGNGLAGIEVRLSGSEKAVIALTDAIERERPVARFTRWRIEAIADGSVRLHGQLVTPWRR